MTVEEWYEEMKSRGMADWQLVVEDGRFGKVYAIDTNVHFDKYEEAVFIDADQQTMMRSKRFMY